ncbi:MAG: glycosyltransferase [Actinomycetota bacterium]
MSAPERPTVLLFFEDFEQDRFVTGDRHVQRLLRRAVHRLRRGGQTTSGYQVWFDSLVFALRRAGCEVKVNDRRAAKRSPDHPVGVCGYPHIIDRWDLPNPAVLGPGLFDHPAQVPTLMDDPRFETYLTTCDWNHRLFAAHWDGCHPWFAGIDIDRWEDLSEHEATTDFLVYDKIRFDRSRMEQELLRPVLARLEATGRTYEVLRYGGYDLDRYRALMSRSRALLFLCEHETQGMAYQEAMASGLPVLAWDNGVWLDPTATRYQDDPVPASSVPYFGPECGVTFAGADEFDDALDDFWSRVDTFEPRAWVAEHLSIAGSAEAYLRAYEPLLPER